MCIRDRLLFAPVVMFLYKVWWSVRTSISKLLFLLASVGMFLSTALFWEALAMHWRFFLTLPLLVFLLSEWWVARASVPRWLFLGCAIVAGMAIVDFPLQNPVVFCLFALSLTMAGKYTLIQVRLALAKTRRK